MSLGVSEVSEQANKWAQRSARAEWMSGVCKVKQAAWSKQMSEQLEPMSERTSEWPSTYVSILGLSVPLCDDEEASWTPAGWVVMDGRWTAPVAEMGTSTASRIFKKSSGNVSSLAGIFFFALQERSKKRWSYDFVELEYTLFFYKNHESESQAGCS